MKLKNNIVDVSSINATDSDVASALLKYKSEKKYTAIINGMILINSSNPRLILAMKNLSPIEAFKEWSLYAELGKKGIMVATYIITDKAIILRRFPKLNPGTNGSKNTIQRIGYDLIEMDNPKNSAAKRVFFDKNNQPNKKNAIARTSFCPMIGIE